MAKKRKKKKAKPKIEQIPKEPEVELTPEEKAVPAEEVELSETPVVEDEQATAPVEVPAISEPAEPSHPVTCSGCKRIVESSTVMPCLNPDCPRSLVFCPDCASAKTCHKCGKKLDPAED